MEIANNIACPISLKKMNGNVNRLAVFMDVLLLIAYMLSSSPYFLLFIVIDYAIKAVDKAKFSPLNWFAGNIVKLIRIPPKLIDQGPKIFAVRVGQTPLRMKGKLFFSGWW